MFQAGEANATSAPCRVASPFSLSCVAPRWPGEPGRAAVALLRDARPVGKTGGPAAFDFAARVLALDGTPFAPVTGGLEGDALVFLGVGFSQARPASACACGGLRCVMCACKTWGNLLDDARCSARICAGGALSLEQGGGVCIFFAGSFSACIHTHTHTYSGHGSDIVSCPQRVL